MTGIDPRDLPAALLGSAAGRGSRLTEWDASIRGAGTGARRLGFVSLAPGAGATTLAAQVLRVLAARRSEPVLAIDVAGGEADLGARLGAAATPPSDARARARTSADAVTGLSEGQGWFCLRPDVSDGPVAAWLAEAAPITRFFEVSITDFGARHPLVDLAACAALCDVVCLVSDARRAPAELARAVAPAIAALPEGPAPVLALVDHARAGEAVARAMASDPWPVVGVPFDRGLRGGRTPTGRARHAVLEVAATVLSGRKAVPA
ncbi:hypothetical protein [Microbacterium sp. BK668]|uniref:hypothetical protein n=1 Tax=Microbacterium sp. BK668 TaxID=2512118 RepID=UPI00105E1F23|nr:hypothetical protein [Microbacterium sp. BK668]TDN91329.1 MinD-like ATPase involved in chromosome partitioning or flagellar assembly [Microbacterium sp. BK668]